MSLKEPEGLGDFIKIIFTIVFVGVLISLL